MTPPSARPPTTPDPGAAACSACLLDVSRALEGAAARHRGFDWATNRTPLPNGRYHLQFIGNPTLFLDPRLGPADTFAAILAGIAELDALMPTAEVIPLHARRTG